MKRFWVGLLAAGFALEAAADSLTIDDAWARATPPNVPTAAGYLEIRNDGEADRLVAVRSEAARAVEIHSTVQDGALMRMVHVDALPVPSAAVTRLEPGGHHIMFMDIAKPFVPGETVVVTLVFEKAGEREVELPVRDARTGAR